MWWCAVQAILGNVSPLLVIILPGQRSSHSGRFIPLRCRTEEFMSWAAGCSSLSLTFSLFLFVFFQLDDNPVVTHQQQAKKGTRQYIGMTRLHVPGVLG